MDPKKENYIDERSTAFFKEWLARFSAWGAVLFLIVGALDYLTFPQYFPLFIRYRVIMALVLIGISVVVRRNNSRPLAFHHALAYLAIVGSASVIELMIMKTGGHTSPYYAGMIVLAICVIGLVPSGLLMSAASTGIIYGIYLLPIIATERILDKGAFITANAFLSAALLTMLLLRQLSQRSLRSEWGLQYDLDQQHGWLEGQVHERTVQLLSVIEDLERQIAERQRAETALLQSEERYRTLAENASDMIYRMSLPDGRYEYVSPASTLLFGYAPEEFYARPLEIRQVIHPDWQGYFKEQWNRLLAGDMPPFYEYQIVHRSGEVRWINQRNMLIRNEQGAPIAIEGIASDVTERKLAEQALKESEEKFRTLFTESKDVFYISTPEGTFLDINPAGVALFGYAAKEELLAINIGRDLYVNQAERRRFIELVGREGYAKDYEVQMKRKSGEALSVIITSTAVRDGSNRITAFRGIIRDVTEQKKLEQQLLQAQKMEAVGQLAGGIAHDFNNILTAIIGFAGLLRKKMPKDEPGRIYIEHIVSSAERAAGLTHSLLAFSRKQVINPRPMDLNEIVSKVEKLLLRLIGEDIECRLRLSSQTLMVTADSLQIEQALMNLATNARDAMGAGGRFTLATGCRDMDREFLALHPGVKAGRYAWIAAADTGSGIEEKDPEPDLRAFLHDQGGRQGDRPRSRHGLRDHQTA